MKASFTKTRITAVFAAVMLMAAALVAVPSAYAAQGSGSLAAGTPAITEQSALKTGETSEWKYTILKNGTVKIDRYIGSKTAVKIPAKLAGKKVTTLDYNVFSTFYSEVKSVKIPATVTKLGYKKVYMVYAGGETWPHYLDYSKKAPTTCAMDPFLYASSLKSITVDKRNKNFKSVNGVLYNKKGTKLLCYPRGKKAKTFKIPSGVTTVAHGSLFSANIDKLVFSKSVRKIESEAAAYSHIKSISFNEGLKTIGAYAFQCSTKLKSVKLPNSVKTLEAGAFSVCLNIKTIKLGKVQKIGDFAFAWLNKNVKSIVIPKTTKTIGGRAFARGSSSALIPSPDGYTVKVPKSVKYPTSKTAWEKNTWDRVFAGAKKVIRY